MLPMADTNSNRPPSWDELMALAAEAGRTVANLRDRYRNTSSANVDPMVASLTAEVERLTVERDQWRATTETLQDYTDAFAGLLKSERERAEQLREALRGMITAEQGITADCIAVKHHLDSPYPDDPQWTPWTRFVERGLQRLDAARRKARVALASKEDIRERVDAAREALLGDEEAMLKYLRGDGKQHG